MNWCPDSFVWSDLRNYCYNLFSTFPWAILTGLWGLTVPLTLHTAVVEEQWRGLQLTWVAGHWDNWVGSNSCCGVVISQISVLPSAALMWLRSELILTVLNPMEVKISSLHLAVSYWSSQYAAKIVFYITLIILFLVYCLSNLQMHILTPCWFLVLERQSIFHLIKF